VRRCYIVSYDVGDDKRLRHVAKIMEAYGRRVQFSVFRCELTPRKRLSLEAQLSEEIHHREDQVLFIDLGPVPGSGEECVVGIGRPYHKPPKRSVVV
jgi:CRISPR-associated protein Cas2